MTAISPRSTTSSGAANTVRAVVFDVDGTLVDHDGAQRAGLTARLARNGQALDDGAWTRWRLLEEEHFARHLAGELTFTEQRRVRVRHFTGQGLSDAEADEWFGGYLAAFQAAWRVFDDVGAALDALAGLRLAAFSNVGGEWTRSKLTAVGVIDRFEVVLGMDEAAAAKPDARAFGAVCARLGVSAADVWHVGDRYETDGRGALAAGLRSIWLDRPQADGLSGRPSGDLDPRIHVVTSLAEVPSLLGLAGGDVAEPTA
jgi:putative hydrolase of the HAD superfamily